ncbi:MAG: ABC transporter permease [Desulfurococcaceae archaeon]
MSASVKLEYVSYIGNVLLALITGLAIGAIIISWGGYDPISAYRGLFETSLNIADPYYLAMTLSYATPLMLTAATFAISARAGVFNIGAEGQVFMGALGAVVVASLKLPDQLYLPMALLLGILMGALWGLIAGLFKVLRNVNEVVVTIMLNWIAYWIVEYARIYVYYDRYRPEKTISMPRSGVLPVLVPGSELSASFIIALIATIIIYLVLWRTRLGYSIRVVGIGLKTAKYAGINPGLTMLYVFIIGGMISGLAGALEICGRPPTYAITTGASNIAGLGFAGISVSLLGLNHPIFIIPASIIIGALNAGSRGMQIRAGVPLEMVKAVQGLIVIALAVPGFTYMLRKWRIRKALRGETGD